MLICLVIKKLNLIVTELCIRGRKLSISFVITRFCYAVLKNIRLNSLQYFVMRISYEKEL